MGIKLVTWDNERARKEIEKKFKTALESRLYHEERWIRNEKTIYADLPRIQFQYWPSGN